MTASCSCCNSRSFSSSAAVAAAPPAERCAGRETLRGRSDRPRYSLVPVIVVSVVVALLLAAPASAADFASPARVAAAMERHYNGAVYKARLAKAGARITGRVLCAYDGIYRIECVGRLVSRQAPVRAEWFLVKATARRARLTYTFEGRGVFQHDSEIVAPSAFRLARF